MMVVYSCHIDYRRCRRRRLTVHHARHQVPLAATLAAHHRGDWANGCAHGCAPGGLLGGGFGAAAVLSVEGGNHFLSSSKALTKVIGATAIDGSLCLRDGLSP